MIDHALQISVVKVEVAGRGASLALPTPNNAIVSAAESGSDNGRLTYQGMIVTSVLDENINECGLIMVMSVNPNSTFAFQILAHE